MPANPIAEDFETTGDANRAGSMSPLGSNISITAAEKRRLEKEHNIKPGTDEWFQLWFAKTHLTGEKFNQPIFGANNLTGYVSPVRCFLAVLFY